MVLQDIVFEGAGHEAPPAMVMETVRFVNESLDGEMEMAHGKKGSRVSRM